MSEIDWKAEGFEGAKLSLLLMQIGFFHDAHRGSADCHAAIELLARDLPSGRSGLSALFEKARRTRWKIQAIGTPFEIKDELKARGYRWDADGRYWYTEVSSEEKEAEIEWVTQKAYRGHRQPTATKVTSKERFSIRA